MSSIPWLADLQDLSTMELAFLGVVVLIAGFAAGFIVDMIMKDAGLGPAPNGVIVLIGVCAGMYLRYRLFAPYRADDTVLTFGMAIGASFLLLFALGLAKSRL
jgi:uncharacterized membrane protein YeaQ/YmgE (transglycosylase-associated protein family)